MPPDTQSKAVHRLKRKPIPPWVGPVPDPMVIQEASLYLRLPVSSVYERTSPGATDPLPHIRVGHLLRFRKIDLDRWLEARNTAAPKPPKPAKKAKR